MIVSQYFQNLCTVRVAVDHGHVPYCVVHSISSLSGCSFFLCPSLCRSLSLSLILLHENNRVFLYTGTVFQLQTSPCFFHTLHSAFLTMFSCHRLILPLKFPHCFCEQVFFSMTCYRKNLVHVSRNFKLVIYHLLCCLF